MIHSDLIALITFCSAAAFSPGPNNLMASYSAFNFGIKKNIPHNLRSNLWFSIIIICSKFWLIGYF